MELGLISQEKLGDLKKMKIEAPRNLLRGISDW